MKKTYEVLSNLIKKQVIGIVIKFAFDIFRALCLSNSSIFEENYTTMTKIENSLVNNRHTKYTRNTYKLYIHTYKLLANAVKLERGDDVKNNP